MKVFVAFCLLVAAVAARPDTYYDTRYDDFDAGELVQNTRLLTAYGHCFLSQGPCTPEGADFKKTIPDALRTSCNKCTAKQRKLIRVVVKGFQEKTPDLWKQLVQKEDPQAQYRQSFQAFLNGSN